MDLSLQLEKIRAVQEAARQAGVPIVLNARTDAYLLQVGTPAARFDLALQRLSAFRDAGADCLFLPGVRDAETITRMVADLKFPLNILAGPGSPPVPELEKLGVARVSLGSALIRATLGLVRRMAEELKTTGTYRSLEDAPPHADVNRMLQSLGIDCSCGTGPSPVQAEQARLALPSDSHTSSVSGFSRAGAPAPHRM